jgi:hypothetical protein
MHQIMKYDFKLKICRKKKVKSDTFRSSPSLQKKKKKKEKKRALRGVSKNSYTFVSHTYCKSWIADIIVNGGYIFVK